MHSNRRHLNIADVALIILLLGCLFSTISLFITGCVSIILFIPYIFVIMLFISNNIKNSIVRFDFITLYIIFRMFIRYFAYPLLLCAVENDSFYNQEAMTEAILLFILEELVIIMTLDFLLKYYSSKYFKFNVFVKKENRSTKYWLIVICVFASLLVMIALPSVRQNYQFITKASLDSMEETDFGSSIESFGYVIVDISRMLVPLIIINSCYHEYEKNGLCQKKYIMISMFAAIIPMLIIKQMKRGASFYTCLIFIWLVIRLYGWNNTKKYTGIIFGVAIALLSVLSMVKHGSAISTQGYTLEYAYDVTQSYSIGIGQLRYGIMTNKNFDNISRFSVAFNDLFCSLPILNRFGDASLRYPALYNATVYTGRYNSNAALAPLLTNMLFTLGPLGFFVPIIFLCLSIKLYFKSLTQVSINKQFVLVYISLLFESGRTGCFSVTLSKFLWIVIPLLLVVILLEKVKVEI